jgi:hypothetical protein
MVCVIWDLDGLALVEIVPPNLCGRAKYLWKFAIPHMEANMKTHRPKQGLNGVAFHWDHPSTRTTKVTIAKSAN